MRRLWTTAALAVPLFLCTVIGTAAANPIGYEFVPCGGGHCFKLFPHIHQHGPLFNYGPYYGYYPFKPYGPWDAYLRYDPFFYGDPYANWGAGNLYGKNPHLKEFPKPDWHRLAFLHASWLQGGWFRGHTWLTGKHWHGNITGCTSAGGVALAEPVAPSGDALARYSGFGTPTQSAVFYTATPTLDPALEFVPTGALLK
jgi:hypothetical protein